MTARIINLVDLDATGTLYESVQEAEQALELLTSKYKSQGYTVREERIPNEDYPQYKIIDPSDEWIGTYTIILD